ncbi:indolepyruvate oxidoreductase subunit beta family protein [Govanella unica]|uniref:Indolepyruvate oxidoreductase subunit beta family protein n=1 Tax=Govanella unica TaxID=2975056 RepID=A0A9X3TXN7_9PROT|nr:indolepyruvate oxidoreductase subunit beta family protein [Govania unica]MDA5193252.1 indolepyruvate oxidoreductase subunit beta family protein [Govania unica]
MTTNPRPISIAIAALGGQGGGVLAQWIVDLAEANAYRAQYTSVPGVAQRTGATIYFVELFPDAAAKAAGKAPVLALMPAPGDVDIVIASELMEAGRSIARGLVSPDFTTLIASDHRVYAIAEKEVMGDGRGDEDMVREAAAKAAKSLILFDMNKVAEETGTVISSVLFGALAGSGALPFPRESYEETIKQTGKAVPTNLKAFARAYDEAQARAPRQLPTVAAAPRSALEARVGNFPAEVQEFVRHGIARLVDYQDQAYATLYLDRLDTIAAAAKAAPDNRLLSETARYLALWMGFEDVIRVADLKTRPTRMDAVRKEVHAKPDQIFYVVEFFHPRFEEVCDTLPVSLGTSLLKSEFARKILAPFFTKGRNIQTAKLSGFLPLFFLARMRRFRRGTLRFQKENALIEQWLGLVADYAGKDYALAAELAECPRLIKGYGDTHERGTARYSNILSRLSRLDADSLRALREAALQDEDGCAFNAELAKVA